MNYINFKFKNELIQFKKINITLISITIISTIFKSICKNKLNRVQQFLDKDNNGKG